jgi:hypothetical protein
MSGGAASRAAHRASPLGLASRAAHRASPLGLASPVSDLAHSLCTRRLTRHANARGVAQLLGAIFTRADLLATVFAHLGVVNLDVVASATSYVRVATLGALPLSAASAALAGFNGIGELKPALFIAAITCACNAALNGLLIGRFGLAGTCTSPELLPPARCGLAHTLRLPAASAMLSSPHNPTPPLSSPAPAAPLIRSQAQRTRRPSQPSPDYSLPSSSSLVAAWLSRRNGQSRPPCAASARLARPSLPPEHSSPSPLS